MVYNCLLQVLRLGRDVSHFYPILANEAKTSRSLFFFFFFSRAVRLSIMAFTLTNLSVEF